MSDDSTPRRRRPVDSMRSRRRPDGAPRRFKVVCSCTAPDRPVVVRKYDVEADDERRAALLALHDNPSVLEMTYVLQPYGQGPLGFVLPRDEEYERPTAGKMGTAARIAILKATHAAAYQRQREEAVIAGADDNEYARAVDSYQGTRRKPVQWRCPKCHRNASPTAKQADTIAHTHLMSGESQVDLVALTRTLGDQ